MKAQSIAFDAAASVRSYDDNGYLHVALTPISKAAVNPYLGSEITGWQEQGLDPERIYYGLRDPQELAKAAPTFNGLPLLLNHHMINAEDIPKEAVIGSTGTDAVFDAPYLKNSLTVHDAEAIRLIEDEAMKELSCGYRYTADFTPGEYDAGEGQKIHYDFVMRDIRGNHLALVERGRAGKDVYVADSLPNFMQKKKEGTALRKNQRIMNFKRRRIMAMDADLGIESSEVNHAGWQKAINVIEAQVEGYDPKDVNLDIDRNATIDQIIEKFMPGLSDQEKETVRAELMKLKGSDAAAADEGGNPMDKMPPAPAAAKDEDYEDERFKNPDFKAGFEEGVRYGEKREKANPERIDRDHEREGEKRYLAQDSIDNIKRAAVQEARETMQKLSAAALKVKPLVGTIQNVMSFDSAEAIYAFALKQSGVNVNQYAPAAYEGMVDMVLSNRPRHAGYAADAAMGSGSLDEGIEKYFANLKNISK